MCAVRWSGSGGGLSRNGWLPTSGGGSTFLLYLRLLLHLPSYTYSCLPTCLLLSLPTIYLIYLPLLQGNLFPPMCTSAGHVGFHFEIDSCDTYTYIRCTCRKIILLSSGMISFLKLFFKQPRWCLVVLWCWWGAALAGSIRIRSGARSSNWFWPNPALCTLPTLRRLQVKPPSQNSAWRPLMHH